jgi:hypothetical protein
MHFWVSGILRRWSVYEVIAESLRNTDLDSTRCYESHHYVGKIWWSQMSNKWLEISVPNSDLPFAGPIRFIYSFIIYLFIYVFIIYLFVVYLTMSRVAQWVKCLATGWTIQAIGVRSPFRWKDFFCSLCAQTGSAAHPASCPMGTGGPFPRARARPGSDADHSPPSSAEVLNE